MSPGLVPRPLMATQAVLTVFLGHLWEAEPCFGLCWREEGLWGLGVTQSRPRVVGRTVRDRALGQVLPWDPACL